MSQPGWYPDPGGSPAMRWWDGQRWTDHVVLPPPPGPRGPGGPAGPVGLGPLDPRRLVADEQTGARRARVALLVGAGTQIVSAVTIAVVYSAIFHDFVQEIERTSRSRSSAPPAFGGTFVGGILVLNVVQIAYYVVGVLFIVWSYQAARAGRALGLPARLESYWSVLGWIVPVVNLWFPFQVVADCLPAGHPARRTVGWWWGLYLGMGGASLLVFAGSFISTPAALVAALAPATLAVLAALKGREMIQAIADEHQRLVDAGGPVAPSGPAGPIGPAGPDGGVGFAWR
ncbi:MAG: DUF4328 domain-containing protein [Acidimicrobiales bacterium]